MTGTVGWMPLAGALIGAMTAGAYVVALHLWPPPVAAGIALIVEALLTGALHEDAAADFCDAFGGSASGDDARRIMRDSRIGSYGALALIVLVGLRWTAIVALPAHLAVAAIVAGAAAGRLSSVALLALAPPVDGAGLGGSVGAPTARGLLLALLLAAVPGMAPLAWMRPFALAGAVIAGAILLGWIAGLVRRRIGGSTGDCLGMAACLGQLVVLLAAIAG
jgi:adenosylcobinamide-GDP ribazoletransferase